MNCSSSGSPTRGGSLFRSQTQPEQLGFAEVRDTISEEQRGKIDRFDLVQLAEVISVCRSSRSLSEAGRTLFQVSRNAKRKPNDADRLRKYLARFGLDWISIQGGR